MAELTAPGLTVPRSIVAADFNGDGHIDLAVGSSDNGSPASGSLLVFLGNGDCTFRGPSFQINNPTVAIGVADFNGDGIPDIVGVTGLGANSSQ